MEKEGKRGPNPALWWVNSEGDEVKWSFRELTDFTCRAANVFTQTCGLQQGDRLALILPRVPEWWLVAVGCIRTASPDHTCIKSKTTDPMVIFFTSGTTGFPKIVETLFKYPITQYITAPCVFRMILQENFGRFPTLEHCSTGGEAVLPEEQVKWRQRTVLLLYQLYGQSETVCGRAPQGPPSPAEELNLPDSTSLTSLPSIRVPFSLQNDPVKTAKVECGDFYNTGDKATIDEEGYIWFLGRDDDIINTSG
ncbi:Acyl-coenzyme A synthetase ACSM1, mitochondrial [Myotis davidii]|uniref:medium-chain acyl-CoA ligase n=1 Tax=Myotis davidii TaxID=225400 RepID=L5LST9_MYODS|nr:Acyl-coenzyme A synthetase ACSM1, mitochondrial [Myotis davidii]